MSTLAQLRTAVVYELGLASSTDETQIDRWCNEAVLRVLLDTHCYVKKSTTDTTANENDYELPTGILAVHQLKNSDLAPLERVSVAEIDEYRRIDSATTASPGGYRYAVDGANMLMLWPTPASVETLTIYYVPRPTVMSDGTHDPSNTTYGGIPTEYHYALELWAYARGSSADDDQSGAQGQRYRELYEAELTRLRRVRNVKAGRRLSPARLGRRTSIPGDPSKVWR